MGLNIFPIKKNYVTQLPDEIIKTYKSFTDCFKSVCDFFIITYFGKSYNIYFFSFNSIIQFFKI